MWKKYRLVVLWVLVLMLAALNFYGDLMREDPRKYDPDFWFPVETRIAELAGIPRDAPPVFLPDMLQEEWDYVCFVGPLQFAWEDPRLEGIEVPYGFGDRAVLSVILRRGAEHETHIFYRGSELNVFHLFGIEDYTACYDDTAVTIEHVESPRIADLPPNLHVKPVGWSGDPPDTLK